MTETFKPNDSGCDLKDAKIADTETKDEAAPEADHAVETPAAADAAEYEQEPADEQDYRQQIIDGEDRVARRHLILEIQRYYQSARFGKYLRELGMVEDLSSFTIAEMKARLAEIRFTIQNKNTGEMIQKGVPQLICAAEPTICRFYDVKGVSLVLNRSETFHDLLEEVALENQTFTNTPAITRLGYEVAKCCIFVHEANRAKAAATVIAEKVVPVSEATAAFAS